MAELVQRHHDYVLGPNQDSRLASVAAGAVLELQLPIDSDAPFILRSRAMRVQYDSARLQTGLNHLLLKWAGPERDYRAQDFIRQSLLSPYFGQLGNPIPVWPNVQYPRNGVIRCQIKNDGASSLTNLTLYWRGVKLFEPGAVKAFTYPEKYAGCQVLPGVPFIYSQLVPNLPVTCGTFTSSTSPPVRQYLQNKNGKAPTDADFVIRGGQAGLPFSTTPVNEVFVKFLDGDEKPYSNDAIHVDVMFGNSAFPATYPAGTGSAATPIMCGPNSPGLFYPEIYVPKNTLWYYELSRNDAGFAGAVPVTFPIALSGGKVFEKANV
jgi:hypothetical protein